MHPATIAIEIAIGNGKSRIWMESKMCSVGIVVNMDIIQPIVRSRLRKRTLNRMGIRQSNQMEKEEVDREEVVAIRIKGSAVVFERIIEGNEAVEAVEAVEAAVAVVETIFM